MIHCMKETNNRLFNSILCVLFCLITLTCSFSMDVSASDTKTIVTHKNDLQFTQDEKQWIKNHPVIRARVGAAPPLHFFEGFPKGISVDYLNIIASRAGFQVEYVRGISWPDALKYIQNHEKIDLILTAKITEERRKVISFTDNYLLMPWVIFTRDDVGFISGIEDLNGKTVSVEGGYVMHRKLASEFPNINILEVETTQKAIEAVATGRAFAHIGNLTITTYLIGKYNLNNVKIAAPTPFDNHNQAMAIRNDWPQLTSIINKTLQSLTPEDHENIRRRWLSIRYEHGITKQDVIKWVLLSSILLVSIIIVIMFWNQKLKKEITQHKKSKDLLAASEKRYRQIFETNPAIKLIINPKDGSIIEINKAACDFYGYSKDEFMSLKITDINVLSQEKVAQEMDRVKSEEKLYFNFPHKLASGEIRDVEVYAGPIQYGQKTYLHSIVHDVSQRKRAEEKLKESTKYYQALFNKNRDGYVINRGSGELIDPNPAFARMLGYSVAEAKKLSFWEITPEKWVELEVNIQGKKLIERGYTDLYEKEYIHRDGTIFPIEVQAFLLNEAKDLDSALIGAFVRDITERKQAEKELNLSNKRYQNLFQNSPVPLWEEDFTEVYKYIEAFKAKKVQDFRKYIDTNPSFLEECSKRVKVLDVNQEALKLYDAKTKEELLGNLDTVFTEKSYEIFKEEIIALSKGFLKFESEGEVKTLSGEGKNIFLKMTIDRGRHGSYRALIATIDHTDRNKMEERLMQAQKMESIGNLAGGIAHDFNNLLYPIIGMSEMLLEDLPPDSLEYDNAQEIFKAGRRAGDLVQQILAFSRQSEHKMTPTRIQNILKEVLKLSRSTIPTNIEIHEDIQQNCGLVMADPTQVHQIAMNLITNAFHAVEEINGAIDIALKEITLKDSELPDSALQQGLYVRMSIFDNGIGMSQNTIYKIFEPYFTTKKQGKGTGLGLAVVYGIVKEHGGDIKVYSEVGKGTTFNIYLPVMKKTAETVSVGQISELETGTERILLVDDEEPVARLEKQMLERLGYKVTAQTSSVDAFNEFKANPEDFDLVISDMTMPNMTGDQLAHKILSIDANTPIIICTGFSERINKEQAENIGVMGFLMKPVIRSEMAKMVRTILDDTKVL